MKVLEIAVGAVFCPDQVFLSNETWLQTEILSKEVQVWGWRSKFDPHIGVLSGTGDSQPDSRESIRN